MAFDTIAFVAALMAVLAFLWNLHRDMGVLRQDMSKDMGALRQDMKRDIQNMNRDIGALRQDMSDVRGDMSDIRDRVSRVEGMLAGAGLKINPDPASG